jgi:hypothetical protein
MNHEAMVSASAEWKDYNLRLFPHRLKNAYYLRHPETIGWETAQRGEKHEKRTRSAGSMRVIRSTTKESEGISHLELWFKTMDQLIDPDDPGAPSEKELTEDAEDRIYSLVNEIKVKSPVQLMIHLPKSDESSGSGIDLPRAIRSHFAFRLTELEGEKRASWHEGKMSFFIAIFNACIMILVAWFYYDLSGSFLYTLLTGLVVILNWVTIWDTYEYFVYDWRHLWRKRKIYEKITRMDVQVRHAG